VRTLDCILIGDFVGAEAALAWAERRIERISPDRRVMNALHVDSLRFWALLEQGDIQSAATLARQVHDQHHTASTRSG